MKLKLSGEPLWSETSTADSSSWTILLLDDQILSPFNSNDIRNLRALDKKLKSLAIELKCRYYAFGLPMDDLPISVTPEDNDMGWKRFKEFVDKLDHKKTVCITDLLVANRVSWGNMVLSHLRKSGMPKTNGCVLTKEPDVAQTTADGYGLFDKNEEESIKGIIEFVRNRIGVPEWKANLLKDLVIIRTNTHIGRGHDVQDDYPFESHSIKPDGVNASDYALNLFYQEGFSKPFIESVSGYAFYWLSHQRHLSSEIFVDLLNKLLKKSCLRDVAVTDTINCEMRLPCQPGVVFIIRLIEFLESLHQFSNRELVLERLNMSNVVTLNIPLDEPQQLMGKLLCRPDECIGTTVSKSLPNLLSCRLFNNDELKASNEKDASRESCALVEINNVPIKYSRRSGDWLAPLVGIDVYDKGIRLLWPGIREGTQVTER